MDHTDPPSETPAPRAGLRAVFGWPITLDVVWLAMPMALIVLWYAALQIISSDYWWPIVFGRLFEQLDVYPEANFFLYTMPADRPFFNQPWLAQRLMYWAHTSLGPALAVAASAVMTCGSFLLMADAALRRQAPAPLVGLGMMGAALVGTINMMVRTQVFAFACFALCLWALTRLVAARDAQASPRALAGWGALVVAVCALWVNLHGSFILGPLLAGAVAAGMLIEAWSGKTLGARTVGGWSGLVAASVAATLLNPYGPRVYVYIANLMGKVRDPATGEAAVAEWRPLEWSSGEGLLCAASLVVGVAVFAAAVRSRRARWHEGFILAGMLIMAVQARRNIIWWELACVALVVPLAAALLASAAPKPPEGAPEQPAEDAPPGLVASLLNAAIALGMIVGAAACLPGMPAHPALLDAMHGPRYGQEVELLKRPERQGYDPHHPLGLIEQLAARGYPGRIFNDQLLSGVLQYYLTAKGPRPVTFVDQRMGLIPAPVWGRYHAIERAASSWGEQLASDDVRTVLVSEEMWRLNNALLADSQWRLVGRELGYRLYMRDDAPGAWPAIPTRPDDRLQDPAATPAR